MQAIKPPGVCHDRNAHGPSVPLDRKPYGRMRLAKLMGLSADASIDQVCNDAANLIEELRSDAPDIQEPEPKMKSRKRQMQES